MKYVIMPLNDFLAFVCFLVAWLGYGYVARLLARNRPSLISAVGVFRQRWMTRICERETHVADATLLSNLLRGALFFASTTVLILGGLVAVLGTGTKVAEVVGQLPYAAASEAWLLEIKALALIVLFVYAFFKFTWSAWQYNVLSIIVGAAPSPASESQEIARYVKNATHIATLAGDSYNNGIRAYYFSIALMAWFIDAWMFLAVTLIVSFVLYQREFGSPMLRSLTEAAAIE